MSGRGRDRVLVAGIGNVFLGDDGFGVEVVRRIDPATVPEGVDVVDYGIRGLHLAYELLDGRYRTLVLVDAIPLQEPPGTLALLEVDVDAADGEPAGPAIDGHGMDPHAVLRLLHNLGGRVERVLVVGCRPAAAEECMGLSEAVAGAVDEAVQMVAQVVRDECAVPAAGTGTGARRVRTEEPA